MKVLYSAGTNHDPIYRLTDRGFVFATEIVNLTSNANLNISQCAALAAKVGRYLPGPIHVFADRLTRNLACVRTNPGLFAFAPMNLFEAEHCCADASTPRFAIGPSLSRYGFHEVFEIVLQIQVEISCTAGEGDFMLQIDQVEYWITMNKSGLSIVADNRLACHDQSGVEASRMWLKAKLEALALKVAD
ncbi:hypothetical protein [Afipia birgiae]|uniref:hypothetical protein n=1 Tax=Afipia birgiae TaxID=151414 RepID=UPI0012EB2BED|nr:hypothetical protein [Afipia birgiae]